MSDNKKYYYLKLKDNFYDSEEIRILESMNNGYKYTTLLLKLYLRSLKNEGALRLNEFIPYDSKMISAVTNMDLDTVMVAMDIFKNLKLIEILEDGTIYLLNIQNYIGESSTEADRIRGYRNSIADKKQGLLTGNTNAVQMYDERTPELELKLELELKKDIDKDIEIIILTSDEEAFITILKTIENYPVNLYKDKDLFSTMSERYPKLDLIAAIQDWSIYKKDKPLNAKSSPRAQINTSFKKYVEWGKCLKTNNSSQKGGAKTGNNSGTDKQELEEYGNYLNI